MKDLVIFGTGEIAAVADFYFTRDAGRRVCAFTVDAAFLTADAFQGRPVVPFEEVPELYPPDRFDLFVAVGYGGLNATRAGRVEAGRRLGYTLPSYVSRRAITFDDLSHGDNCLILENNVIQPFATLGSNVTLWSGNHIGHHARIGDDVFVASHAVVSGGVSVGRACFLGVNATIRDHVTIGERCVLGAGALVLEDLPAGSVVAPRASEVSRVPSYRLRRI